MHGSNGPINVSFSTYIYQQTSNVFSALDHLGIPLSSDPNDGTTAGAAFLPASIDPVQQTRVDALTAYNASIYARQNLDVWTGQYVTRILFQDGAGTSNSTTPVSGDTSIGQGNATNTDGTLFGVDNSTKPTSFENQIEKTSIADRKRSIHPELRKMAKLWAKHAVRQSTGQQATSTNTKLRAVGVEVSRVQVS